MSFLDSLFKKKGPKASPKAKQEKPSNPYLEARRSMNEKAGLMFQKIKTWQIFSLMEFAVILGLIGVLCTYIQAPKYIPYVVELDKLGVVVNSRPANSDYKASEQVIKSTVADFITNLRMVTADIALQNDAIRRVFAHLNASDPARRVCLEWYDQSPFERAKEFLVTADVKTVLRQGDSTWQVEWTETVRNHNGDLITRNTMRALVTVYQSQSDDQTTDQTMRLNPLSIFVRDLSWTKVS